LTNNKLPAISGKKLIDLLKKDGWIEGRRATHGLALTKKFKDKVRVAIIPTKGKSLPTGTLMAILSDKQTGLGKEGLLELIKRYGL